MKHLIPLLLLSSCSALTPSLPTLPTPSAPTTPTTQVGAAMKGVEDSLWNYAWLSIILVFVFPSMRAPIVAFLKALFTVLRLPLDHVIMLYNQKYKKDAEKEEGG